MFRSGWILVLCLVALGGASSNAAQAEERNCSVSPPYHPPTAVDTTERLRQLRDGMKRLNIGAYIIPGTDAHLSEYISQRDARLTFISGFTGSSGTAVVTQNKAALFTDSRYWIQAERQMYCIWDLEKEVTVQSISKWLITEVPEGHQVGFDPFLFSIQTFNAYQSYLAPANLSLKSIPNNMVDEIWKDRPALSQETLTRLPDRIIGRTWQMKVDDIRRQMNDNAYKPTAVLLSALDETAWLFNLRGNDIPYNPFFFSYTLLSLNETWLFVHTSRLTDDLRSYLTTSCTPSQCVKIFGYDTVRSKLQEYVSRADVRVWVGTEYTNQALFELITPQEKLLTTDYSPVLTSKAVKDQTEERVLREAHVRDAVAVIQLMVWLEKRVPGGTETEITAANFVDHCRSKQKDNKGPSFGTISAGGPNAALAHYSPSNETARKLTVDEMYLVDSGGQYLDGTTDITRTVHWGKPTAFQKEAYTRVLIGNIELSRVIFPAGKKGVNMEILARRALWEVGLDYGHGTGHGVGNYFAVHEWPVGFQSNNIPFQAGMFTSIEPGYYKANEFGIRIEDIAVTVPAETKYGSDHFLTFDIVSLVPYDRNLIDMSLLSPEQLNWLNSHYEKIRRLMGPELERQGLKEEHDWMMKHTEPFSNAGSSAAASTVTLTLMVLPTFLTQQFL
ncbi:xaa-Pro aminopeptidase 2 [Chanos chanos]|uniref:Xaa-Pro aminopeptidase 2 n=1 Tax=Chanos chanos TaxID=29144 RepID=A0A6J2UPY4_CHACN|nr:xaa-Pro aminopeptidase 2 [Chanos chanos]